MRLQERWARDEMSHRAPGVNGMPSVFTIPNTLVLRHAYLPKKVVSLLKCFRQ